MTNIDLVLKLRDVLQLAGILKKIHTYKLSLKNLWGLFRSTVERFRGVERGEKRERRDPLYICIFLGRSLSRWIS